MRGSHALVWLVLIAGCTNVQAEDGDCAPFIAPFLPEHPYATPSDPIEPLPLTLALDPAKVALGRQLFVEPRLSADGRVTCAHCHSLALGGANGQVHSKLAGRPEGSLNVPSVFNVAFDFRYAWNGRYDKLEDILDFAIASPAAMAGSWRQAWHAIAGDANYARVFATLYPERAGEVALRDALVWYLRSLITPNARFDRYLRGQLDLDAQQKLGYQLFRDYGCISCHQGINIGGNMFQRFGVMRDYFEDRGHVQPVDTGLFKATGDAHDKFVFRVPSLRNVALTAPYFHDGSVATLEGAAKTMARYQLGRELTSEEASAIAAFLRTLTGELEGRPL